MAALRVGSPWWCSPLGAGTVRVGERPSSRSAVRKKVKGLVYFCGDSIELSEWVCETFGGHFIGLVELDFYF